VLPMPDRAQFTRTETGRARAASAVDAEYDKAVRQRWRALALVVKAKLEAVDSEITTFEDEFLAHTVLPSGRTVSEEIMPSVDIAIASGGPLQIEAP
jgi:hypothetical protein